MKIDANKIIGVLIAAVLGMGAWYLKDVASELKLLRTEVQQVKIDTVLLKKLAEINAGGDPSTVLNENEGE